MTMNTNTADRGDAEPTARCEDLNCDQLATELIVNFCNLSEYKWTCPKHRNQWLYRSNWYRASEDVRQVVLMNQVKDDRLSSE
jgi:hypothetical protein